MRAAVFLLLPFSLLGGNAGAEPPGDARDAAFRAHVADMFAADCLRARAPNAAQLRVLRRLCSCSEARIRASDIAFADGQDLVTRKVHQLQEACLGEVYGGAAATANRAH